ncbi:MAG: hypothetical protein EOO88_05375 [Pedobacter sp.]|nr:MAG: hypothetical protein EOO88_05375 [Pedobacter sp.]
MPGILPPNKVNTRVDLSNSDFSGQNLSGYVFIGCNLTGVNFSGSAFDSATEFTDSVFGASAQKKVTSFADCILTAAKFTEPAQFGRQGNKTLLTNLTGATVPWKLLGKKCQFTDLSNARITDLPADFARIDFKSVRWNNFDFKEKSIRNAHFTECELQNCKMNRCELDFAVFISCNLNKVTMAGASLDTVVFDNSDLTSTDLSYASRFREISFRNALLQGTRFDGNNITDSKFSIPCKTSTDPAYITSFQFATVPADFMLKNLQKNWQCLDLRNVIINDFSSITGQLQNLKAMYSFFNSSLSFEKAFLNVADFKKASFNGVNFNNAILNGSTLTGINTVQGTEMGNAGARINILPGNALYSGFLELLNKKDTEGIKRVFAACGLTLQNVECAPVKDAQSNLQTWHITDVNSKTGKKYIIIQFPVSDGFKYAIFDNSPSTFSYARMVECNLQDSNFSNSNLAHAQLYGSNITYAILSNANFTAAQFGKNAAIFSMAESDTSAIAPYDYKTFLNSVQQGVLKDIIDIFQWSGYSMGNITCVIAPIPAGAEAAWMITDNSTTPVRKFLVANMVVSTSPKARELTVIFENGQAANLYSSYMPGVNLTEANLTGCNAQKCHLYNNQLNGSNATLTKAILIGANFDDANLYKADFTKAILNGVSFNRTNLMGANFKGVTLAPGVERAISFTGANLQGTDFSDAAIVGGILLEAAISLPKANSPSQTNGVQIQRVYDRSDNDFAAYLLELVRAEATSIIGYDAEADADKTDKEDDDNDDDEYDNAYVIATKYLETGPINNNLLINLKRVTKTIDGKPVTVDVTAGATVTFLQKQRVYKIISKTEEYLIVPGYNKEFLVSYNVYAAGNVPACSIDYYSVLKEGPVTKDVSDAITAKSKGKIVLAPDARLTFIDRPVSWRVEREGVAYILWWGVKLVKKRERYKLANVIYVRRSVDALQGLFQSTKISLRNQTLFRKLEPAAGEDTVTWLINTGKDDALYLNAGYIQYKMVASPATAPTRLVLYGYTMRMIGFGNNQRQVMQDFDCEPTMLNADALDDKTTMPNNKKKFENQADRTAYEEWMWVSKDHIPEPPVCVPSPISYCPTLPGKAMRLAKADVYYDSTERLP